MNRFWSRLGIARQLYVLGALVFLPFAAIVAQNIQAEHQLRIDEMSRNAFRHAIKVAEQTAHFNRQSFALLQSLALRPAIRAMSSAPCDPVFDHFMSSNQSYANLLLDNADGDVICNAAKGPNLKGLVTHRPWFKTLMATGKRQVGDPTVGRVVGRWIIALAEPVFDPGGRLRGTLVLTVDLWNYQLHLDRDFAESFFLATVLDSNGMIVARSRDPEKWVGRKFQASLEEIRAIKPGDGRFAPDSNGVKQLYGHAAVPDTDWVVLVSSPKTNVNAALLERIRFELPFAGMLFFLLFTAAYLVARRIREPLEVAALAAEAVGDGRLGVRLPEEGGNRELGVLAQKFNRMAEQRSSADARQAAAMAALTRSEERLHRALSASRLALWDHNLQSGEVYLSEVWSELLGGPHTPTFTTIEALAALTSAEDWAAITDAMVSLFKGVRQTYQVEHRVRKTDGEFIWIVSEGQVIERNAEGRALRAIGTNRDITKRKQMEQALHASEAELRLITDNVPLSISFLDTALRFRFSNRGFSELFGLTPQEALGRPLREAIGEPAYALVKDYYAQVLAGGEVTYERTLLRAGCEARDIETRLIPHFAEDNRVDGCYALTLDVTERKLADAARGWLAAIVEHSNDAIIGRSLDGRILSWNTAAERLFGYRASEAIGRPITLIMPPDASPSNEINSAILQSGGVVPRAEAVRRTKGGQLITVLRSISPIRNAAGEVIGAAVTARDITARKRADEALRRFRVAMDNSADMILLVDRDTMRYADVNETVCRLLGYSREELTHMGPQDILPVDRETLERSYDELFATPSLTGAMNSTYRCKDGSLLPFESTRHVMRSESEKTVVIIARDIRERNRAEAQQRLAASVFDNALDGIMITDPDFRIMAVNRAFTQITGYSAQEAIGNSPRLLRSYRHDDSFYADMRRTIDAIGSWQGEIWDQRKNGELYCEHLSISAVRSDAGDVVNYCAIFGDITRLKNAEADLTDLNARLEERVAQRTAELDRANRELETFSYSVSHDLRAPLRHINGFSQIVLKANENRLDEASVASLKRIVAASDRMGRLITDLLALSHISSQKLNRQEFDLSALAGAVIDVFAESHPERKVRLALAPGTKANGDPGLVRIVLENLLGNALKFSAGTDDPQVEIGHSVRDGASAYYVRDNGVGFDMEYAHKLFVPFQRLHAEREFEGTGIGLSIVQRIVSRHGGRVWVNAEEGKGAEFCFTLGEDAEPV